MTSRASLHYMAPHPIFMQFQIVLLASETLSGMGQELNETFATILARKPTPVQLGMISWSWNRPARAYLRFVTGYNHPLERRVVQVYKCVKDLRTAVHCRMERWRNEPEERYTWNESDIDDVLKTYC